MIDVNMCDRDQSNFNSVLSSAKETVGRYAFPLTFPVNEGEGFNQIADVLNKKLHTFKNQISSTVKNSNSISQRKISRFENFDRSKNIFEKSLSNNFFFLVNYANIAF